MTTRISACATAALLLSGCAAHSPMILRDTVDVTPAAGAAAAAPHSRKVLVAEGPLPPGVRHEVLGTLQVGTVWYGGGDKVDQQMADRARAMGADAVVDVKHWRQPSGFSWAAPHGSGRAVRLQDTGAIKTGAIKLDTLPGRWL